MTALSTDPGSQHRTLLQARLAAGVVAWAREALELTYPEIGNALDVTRRTVMRWAQSEHAPTVSHLAKLEELSELRHLLETVFPDSGARMEWLHSPVPLLRGRTPMSFIRQGELKEVIGILAGLEAGAFA
jgi:transcriptional regulator with XRE-family HTH domain